MNEPLPPQKRPFASNFLHTISANWKTLSSYALIGALLLFLYSFVQQQTFVATTTVMPPEKQGVGGMLALLASSSALDILKGESSSNPALEQYKMVIDSRSVAEEVAKDPIVHAYFAKRDTSFKGITSAVQSSMTSEALRIGMLSVVTQVAAPRFASSRELDSAKKMAAFLANKYVEELDRFNRDRLLTSAHVTRVFVEGEYNSRLAQLDTAYARMQEFQEAHQAIALPEQLSATVTAAAKLTGKLQELQMQRDVEAHELGASSPQMKALDAAIEAAQLELQKYDDGGGGNYVLALKNVPALSRELAGRLREIKVLEQVCGFLRQELEQDRITEQRDLPSLQVLDSAQPPLHRSSPSRSLHILAGFMLGLLVAFGAIYTKRYTTDIRQRPHKHYRFINFVRSVRNGENAELLVAAGPQSTGSVSTVGATASEAAS